MPFGQPMPVRIISFHFQGMYSSNKSSLLKNNLLKS
uniref:Uncharacterized protein n=1 Tax=Ascaris lumbricoides TaxID=6252 RepID=A0A0M3HM63_ASCLU